MLVRVSRKLPSLSFWRHLLQLNAGLMLLGLGIALMLHAHIGLGPWPVFHEGVSLRSGWSFGRVTQVTGLLVIAAGYFLFQAKPGLGTLLNMLLVGPWVDLFRAQAWIPTTHGLLGGLALFLPSVALVGLASGLYITAGLGAGPRDGFVLGLADATGFSVRRTRSGLELLVLVTGFLLGGSVGWGTLLFALSIGPLMQFFLRVFRPRRSDASALRG